MAICICEQCGAKFDKDKVIKAFEEKYMMEDLYMIEFPNNDFCLKCASELYDENEQDGVFSDGETCTNCGSSLRGAFHTSQWEDGDNAYAYVICPSCGCKNLIDEE